MIRLLLLFCFAICFQQVNAQTYTTRKTTSEKALKFYKSGRKSAKVGDFEKAIKFYNKALKEDPNFIDAKSQIANCKHDKKDYEGAIADYQSIIESAPNYSKNIYYTLALTQWKIKKYEVAVASFKDYLSKETENEARIVKTKQYIANGNFAAKAIKNPVPYNPQRLTDNINTPDAQEYLPTITADDESFIFTRQHKGSEDFFYSKRTADGWSEAVPMASINTHLNEGAQTISGNGKLFIFTGCNRKDGLGSCDLYYSRQVTDGQWSKPRNLGQPINSPAWESQPSLSTDGRTLYFVSDRAGVGKKDIFVCYRKKKGWTEPKPLSDVINTSEHDQSPFLHPDGKTLYFMSQGHPGMGKDDLYFSKKQTDGSWSTPQNLGYPINTEEHEGAIFIARDGKTAYFASDRMAKKTTEQADANTFENPIEQVDIDIYSFELPVAARATPVTYVKAIVKDAETKKPLQSYAQMTSLSSQTTIFDGNTDKAGELFVCIPMGDNYALHIERPGYAFHSENFALMEKSTLGDPFTLEIFLKKIPEPTAAASPTTKPVKSEPIILKNVFFATGSDELRPESVDELTRLKKMLETNPTLRIQINGHTDNVGNDQSNLQLSDNRAKAVEEFLIKNGIDTSRLSHKGFGETSPIDSNDNEIGRQNNRRTEFLIL